MKFKLVSDYKPIKDQLNAAEALKSNLAAGVNKQVLLGVTGSGKTFTVANLIEQIQKPTLIISHNKTLAVQLYQEFRDFFPENAVSYFVSYYDYYQPEAYIPSTDTYIEKDADINETIDKLRLAATTNLLTRKDVIVVASVSCIYNIGSPQQYGGFVFKFSPGTGIRREQIIDRLVDLQYERGDFGFHRGTFRVRGDSIDIFPAYSDEAIRIKLKSGKIEDVETFDPVSGEKKKNSESDHSKFVLYPAKHFITDPTNNEEVFTKIESDMRERVKFFEAKGKLIEANRIKQKVTYDIEMIREVGYVKGIENYSRYFDGRSPGDAPFTLLDYFTESFGKEWLTIIDESHITFPQIRGMFAGDLSRKQTLIDYGFRLPSALDNRPLKFDEFMRRVPGFIATSATPSDWEKSQSIEAASESNVSGGSDKAIIQQLLRPTAIPDPNVEIRPTESQVADVIDEIKKETDKKYRTLVTTLTKKTAEDLSTYLNDRGIKAHYLHSDIKTLQRSNILDDLRSGNYDCLVGVNLLREGLDLPEVSLVAILDADKEGFLRSEVSLVQTMGRAARHVEGRVILYADKITGSIERSLREIERRRKYQLKMNKKYSLTPRSIQKPIREKLAEIQNSSKYDFDHKSSSSDSLFLPDIDVDSLTPLDKKKVSKMLKREMLSAARDLNFELAAEIRDKINELS